MNFQKAYLAALDFFEKEKVSRQNPAEFMSHLDDFISYFANKSILAPNVVNESQRVLKNRFEEVMPFLAMRMSGKEDMTPFDSALYFTPSLGRLVTLHEKADIPVPQELAQMTKFVADFNVRAKTLIALKDSMDRIAKFVKDGPQMPADDFFKGVVARITAVQNAIPAKNRRPVRQVRGVQMCACASTRRSRNSAPRSRFTSANAARRKSLSSR